MCQLQSFFFNRIFVAGISVENAYIHGDAHPTALFHISLTPIVSKQQLMHQQCL